MPTPQELLKESQRLEQLASVRTGVPTKLGNLPALPSQQQTITSARTLPQAQPSRLVDFVSTLDATLNLARQKRNEINFQTFGKQFEPGTISPTSFGSLFGALSQASTEFTKPLLQETMDIIKEEMKKPEASGEIGQFVQAKELGLIPKDMGLFDFIRKSGEAEREVKDETTLTSTQINSGMAASGKTREQFLALPEQDQLDFVFGEKKGLVKGRISKEKLVELKTFLKEAADEQDRKTLEERIDSLNLPAGDKLELLIYLDEIKPIKVSAWEGFKGLF